MADKKKPWGKIVLVVFVVFCLLPIGLWSGAIMKGQRDYEIARTKWTVVFDDLVTQRATVEEVKEAIRSNGREPFEQEVDERTSSPYKVGTFVNDINQYWFVVKTFSVFIEFDEDMRATKYDLYEGGYGL